MNSYILQEEVQQFIANNLHIDVAKLILKGSPFTNITSQELANQLIAKEKSKKKLPTWFTTKNIYYPSKISIEQTSSEITANYKASLVSGDSLIDITGGFGVDTFEFSKKFNNVTHCEINTELSTIVAHNYKELKIANVNLIAGNGLDYLRKSSLEFDWIYIDPSRRNEAKGKVFLLNDCLPNVPQNLDFLFSKSKCILLKNSPMLDISKTINELKFVKEIHVVALQNEVKELLFILEKGFDGTLNIKTINLQKTDSQIFNFEYNKEVFSTYSEPLNYLYEPNAAILKSGAFHQVSMQLKLHKLHQNTHLYTSKEFVPCFPGRAFQIKAVLPYNKKNIYKEIEKGKANITVRNFPKTVAQIRKETKIKDGGTDYLFFATINSNEKKVLFCNQLFHTQEK
ncbi:class I SAM-dependent methyltransferase [Tenacibaculum maritimum]|nr:class I SAM-dependent methyltransferase [Tenacibaculum maritimum]MDB0599615.1 class I SAM-dependent methyltransferase [Tenacibaculum maritimum]MDB0613965.1 class I SAM-dependent methyltransferase [Tenacibaculum maritimum]